MRTHMTGAAALLLAMAGLASTSPPAPHITPTVVLRKQADVIRNGVPDASQFFVKTVRIGQDDYRALAEGGFRPDEEEVKFYYGTGDDGSVRGVVLFPQVNTSQHGPVEIGLALTPDGTIHSVVVTKATVETKPWVQAAESTDLLPGFVGMGVDGDPQAVLQGVSKEAIGEMPYYVAGLIAQNVQRGLAFYRTLYSGDRAE